MQIGLKWTHYHIIILKLLRSDFKCDQEKMRPSSDKGHQNGIYFQFGCLKMRQHACILLANLKDCKSHLHQNLEELL